MGVFRSYREAPASRRAFRCLKHYSTEVKVKVAKREFDAILNRLIAMPPKPVTPKRKMRKVRQSKLAR
jgi:hypothetical protein